MTRTYRVELGRRSYNIHIEPGCLGNFGIALRGLLPEAEHCLIVSNDVVAPLYLERVKNSLEESGWKVAAHILPDGERFKRLETWSGILDTLMQERLTRQEPVIALGGGVVGDMAGFAAACYRRGVPLIQIPTTLLAQVDSSVGGKTAVNHSLGKNMIGSFYQPDLVWIDPEVLDTLPQRELRAGVAEVVKYGLIRDVAFFSSLEDRTPELLNLNADALMQVIHTSCRHKSEVVMRDELERGERALLNLGHTFGHAIEAMTQFQSYLHGEAVAIGTLMASRLSEQLGHAPAGTEERICKLFKLVGLPVDVPEFEPEQWLEVMGHDKKSSASGVHYVLLRGIGNAFVAKGVPDKDIRTLIRSYQ